MFNFTKQERLVLIFLSSVIIFGSILHYSFKQHPNLLNIINVTESERLYPKLDVNKASKKELIDIPYIGEYTARKIIEYRDSKGPLNNMYEILDIEGIREENYRIFARYLKI